MKIAKATRRWLLILPATVLLSVVTWGQSWQPRGAVRLEFGAPVQYVQVERHWDEDYRWDNHRWDDRGRHNDRWEDRRWDNHRYEASRWDRDRAWREHEWREHERREEWREHHPHFRGY